MLCEPDLRQGAVYSWSVLKCTEFRTLGKFCFFVEAGCRKRAALLNNAPYVFSTFDWLSKDPGCDQNFKKIDPSPIHVQKFSEVATAVKEHLPERDIKV